MATVTTRIDKGVKAKIDDFKGESGLQIPDYQIVSEGVLLWLLQRGEVYLQARNRMEGNAKTP